MPTRKPRMSITLPDDVARALYDLADATEKPAATVVADLLQEMRPQLEGLAKVARAAKSGNKVAAKNALRHLFGDSLAEVLRDQADMFQGRKP